MSAKDLIRRLFERVRGPQRHEIVVTILAPETVEIIERSVRPQFEALVAGRHIAERRAALNGAWAVLFFGLLATSWEAALLWFLAA
jgi:hypothetical protein